MRDILEECVEEKYYLSEKQIKSNQDYCDRKQAEGCGFRFEPTTGEGVAKCISTRAGSRQTDNYVIINPLKGISGKGWHFEQNVYDANGITRAIKAGGGSGNIPKVLQIGNIYPDTENFKNRTSGRVYDKDGISPTLNTCSGGGHEPKIVVDKTICINSKVNGKQPSIQDRIYDTKGVSTAITTSFLTNISEDSQRIRKLTPRECFRLMGVSEENIDKIQAAGISNSQQYKLAGNSIVVDVLYYIFKNLLCTSSDHTNQTLFPAQGNHSLNTNE